MKLLDKYKEAEAKLALFYDEDKKPYDFSPGQKLIYKIISARFPKYNHIITTTQYGKSLIIGLAILSSAALGGNRWAIVAPNLKKTMIIMNYILKHAFDNVVFYSQLIADTSLDKLKQERSRQRLVFKNGGEIFVVTADTKNKKKAGEALMGFGAPNLAIDESSLIDDDVYATALRMVGGVKDHFVVEIGNPFQRNHFYETSLDDTYFKILIDYEQAIREGRLDPDFVEKMRKLPFFDILYGCKFPQADFIDDKGYTILTPDTSIKDAFIRAKTIRKRGRPRLGVDVGRGGDATAFVLRYDNYARLLETNNIADTMQQVVKIQKYMGEYDIDPADIFIDDIGVGGGVTDRCVELDIPVNPVRVSEAAVDSERYANLRAELHWEAKVWIEDKENAIEEYKDFYDFSKMRYKEDSGTSRLSIKAKAELKKELGRSPDVVDAFLLTFAPQTDEFDLMAV